VGAVRCEVEVVRCEVEAVQCGEEVAALEMVEAVAVVVVLDWGERKGGKVPFLL
jgi:hypothetical protein